MLSNELYVINVDQERNLWQVRLRSSHQVFSTAIGEGGLKDILKRLVIKYKDYATLRQAIGKMEYNRPLKEKDLVKRTKEYKNLDPKEVTYYQEYIQGLEGTSNTIEGNKPKLTPKKTLKVASQPIQEPSASPTKLSLKKKDKPVELKTKTKPKASLGLKRRIK